MRSSPMIGAVARKLFGSANERRIRSYQPRVAEINALEPELEALSGEALRARTDAFKKQVAEGASLDDILVPAFATCLLYTSDAADDLLCVDLGGRRIIKKKNNG